MRSGTCAETEFALLHTLSECTDAAVAVAVRRRVAAIQPVPPPPQLHWQLANGVDATFVQLPDYAPSRVFVMRSDTEQVYEIPNTLCFRLARAAGGGGGNDWLYPCVIARGALAQTRRGGNLVFVADDCLAAHTEVAHLPQYERAIALCTLLQALHRHAAPHRHFDLLYKRYYAGGGGDSPPPPPPPPPDICELFFLVEAADHQAASLLS